MKQRGQQAREIESTQRTCQPSRAEVREESDMPGTDMERVREEFFTPIPTRERQAPKTYRTSFID